jgi:hypothetical protein
MVIGSTSGSAHGTCRRVSICENVEQISVVVCQAAARHAQPAGPPSLPHPGVHRAVAVTVSRLPNDARVRRLLLHPNRMGADFSATTLSLLTSGDDWCERGESNPQ